MRSGRGTQQRNLLRPELRQSSPASGSGPLLPTTITLNSVSMEPIYAYDANDASILSWPGLYGPTLTGLGSGGSVVDATFFGSTGKIALPGGTRYWKTTDNTASIGTSDFVLEMIVLNASTGSSQGYMATYSGTGAGYRFSEFSTNVNALVWNDSTGNITATTVGTGGGADGAYAHLLYIADRSGFARFYVNGVVESTASISGRPNSLASGLGFTIGALTNGANILGDGGIVWAAAWEFTDIGTHAQDAFAAARYGLL